MINILNLDKDWRADDEFFLLPGFDVVVIILVVVVLVVVLVVFCDGGVFNLSLYSKSLKRKKNV